MKSISRRAFFKNAAIVVGGITAFNFVGPSRAEAQASKGVIPLLIPGDSTAKAVKYVEDYKKVPASKGNHCANCAFYAKKEIRAGKEVGTCLIFAGKYVLADAYCASWAKKS
ncbi:hypothetical protein AZI86_09730 [Bdellovibrio bacteriovorus]|uniref:High potential iron-sulfur proteins family profile domain-containing protein n=1 Tax=Bdellovibrio bacteriovorus TaxID=959 RepID=A0A150WRY0_BDEBC|nr:high-potential iron-sulfur protein [Bdellovibrio bacteriovorus]KYG67273.1 hypothetical protein AZI86_09730 [Bdellovibrio bacteriovorus]